MNGLLIFCVLGLVSGIGILVWERIETARQCRLMQLIHESVLYDRLFPVIREAFRKDVDEIVIEPDWIAVYGMMPPEKLAEFDFDREQFQALDDSGTQALAQVLAMDLRVLQSAQKYRFQAHRALRSNGEWYRAYTFTARPSYKKSVLAQGLSAARQRI